MLLVRRGGNVRDPGPELAVRRLGGVGDEEAKHVRRPEAEEAAPLIGHAGVTADQQDRAEEGSTASDRECRTTNREAGANGGPGGRCGDRQAHRGEIRIGEQGDPRDGEGHRGGATRGESAASDPGGQAKDKDRQGVGRQHRVDGHLLGEVSIAGGYECGADDPEPAGSHLRRGPGGGSPLQDRDDQLPEAHGVDLADERVDELGDEGH